MTDTTPRLALPLLHAAQAQKEFTHNEALTLLDALVGGVLAGGPLTLPPADAAPGSLWLVGEGADGVWAGQDDRLAIASASGWRFVDPPVGLVLARADGLTARRTDRGWSMGEGAFRRLTLAGAESVSAPSGGEVVDVQARVGLSAVLNLLKGEAGPSA